MKKQMNVLVAALGASLGLVSGAAMAESTYGYDTTPANAVSATAKLKITVNIPKLVILRVGSASTTVDELTFNATPNIPTSPSPVATAGNSQAADWTGAAPTFTTNTVGAVSAYLWHNAAGGATLSCAVTPFSGTGALTAADITVTSTGLAHPGGTTECGAGSATTGLTRNTALTGSWTYGVSAAGLAAAAASAGSEVVTYTATTL